MMDKKDQRQLVVIDSDVDQPETLLADVGGRAHCLTLRREDDALERIARELDVLGTVDELHIVSHGTAGALHLAGEEITLSTLASRSETLTRWADALSTADVLLYGCEVGKGREGAAFLDALAALTGAHIAAAETNIGQGVWDLPAVAGGAVHSPVVFSRSLQMSYASVFANVNFSISEAVGVEDEGTPVTFTFTLDEAPAPGEFVSVWWYASTEPGTAPANARTNEISQFNVFELFNPSSVVGIPLVAPTNGVPAYDADASVTAGASSVPDFTVFELRLTQVENSITLPVFNDFVDDGPREVYWNVVDNPLDGQSNTITNGTIKYTEVDTASEIPDENTAPEATDDAYETAFDAGLTVDAASGVLANDSDADGDSLTVALDDGPDNGTLTLNADGSFEYTPDAGFTGDDSFTYTIDDGNGGTDTGSVTVTVDAPDPLPVVGFTSDITTLVEDEGTAVTFTFNVENLPPEGVTVALGVYRPGDSGDDLVFRALGDYDLFPPAPQIGFTGLAGFPFGFNGNTGLAFTIAENGATITLPIFNDDDIPEGEPGHNANQDIGEEQQVWRLINFSNANPPFNEVDDYLVQDGAGEVTLTLKDTNAVNADPEAADDAVSVAEDGSVLISVLDNDTDSDGDTLTVTGAGAVGNGSLVDNGDGTFTYTPDANFNGSDSFTYEISDGNGGTASATVNITVDPVNDAPEASDDAVQVAEDGSVSISVLDNDEDVDGDTLTIASIGAAANGTVVDNGDGTLTYTPNAGFNGSDSFTYEVSDGNGGTDTATVNVSVDSENDAPTAGDDTAVTDEDQSVTVNVLENDDDEDGDTLTISAVGAAANGTVTDNGDGTLTYTPNADFAGTDSFSYTIADGNGGSATATVNVTIDPVNDAPEAADDTAQVVEDGSVSINVLENDADVDGDTLSIVSVGAAGNGSVVDNGDGTLTYTPNAGFSGSDSFTYEVSDGNGGTDTATVSLSVGAVNDPPEVIEEDLGTVSEDAGAPVTFDILANIVDEDTDIEDITISNLSAKFEDTELSVTEVDGVISFDPTQLGDLLNEGDLANVTITFDTFDGDNTVSNSLTLGVEGADEDTGPNPILGTAGSDRLVGTDGDDVIESLGGRYDRLTGGEGADIFVFGDELSNGVRERDVINDYEVGVDSIQLAAGTQITSIRETSSSVVIFLDGDNDAIYVRGEGLSAEDLTITYDDPLTIG